VVAAVVLGIVEPSVVVESAGEILDADQRV